MRHGQFSEQEFAREPAYPNKPQFSQIEYINDASAPISHYWVPTDFDMLIYYRPGHLKGYIKITVDVHDFTTESQIRDSQFGPYSNCSLNGYGTVKPWWWVDPNESEGQDNQND